MCQCCLLEGDVRVAFVVSAFLNCFVVPRVTKSLAFEEFRAGELFVSLYQFETHFD